MPTRRPVPVRLRDWQEVYEPFPRDKLRAAGRALHGLRHPVLQQRLPARQPHPRLERPRLPRPLAATRSSGCTPPTTSPSSPAGSARRRARPRACSASTQDPVTIKQVEVEIVDRAWDEGWVAPAAADGAHRASGRGRRLGPGRSGRRAAARPAPATTSSCSSGPTASAACCATASPSSRWRSATSTAASRRWRPRAPSSAPNADVGVDVDVDELRAEFDAIVLAGGATAVARPADPRARAHRHLPGDGVPAAGEPGAGGRPRRVADHRRRASTS